MAETEKVQYSGMTVGDLKKFLENVHDDFLVIVEKDAEGNGYSPLSEVGMGHYRPDSTYSGEVYHLPEMEGECQSMPPGRGWCIVLGPVN